MATWSVRVIGAPGVAFTPVVMTRTKVLTVKREKLPGLGMARFACKTKNPHARLLDPDLMLDREVQIFRNGKCVWWGVVLQSMADLGNVVFTGVGLLWWFTRRYFGPVVANFLDPNADFEDGLTGWTLVGCAGAASTSWYAKGTQSAKLTQGVEGADAYLRRRHTTSTTTDPRFFASKALIHIPAAGWVGPALDQRGLYMELQTSPGGPLVAGVEPVTDPITNEARLRGAEEPIRLETGITVPPGLTGVTIEERLYAAAHTDGIYYDATAMTNEESVGSTLVGSTLDAIFANVLEYAWGPEKGDLAMSYVAEPGTYPVLRRHHQFYDDGNVFDGLMSYVRDGLAEFDVTWPDDGSSRTFRVWAPKRGTHRAGAVVALQTNVGDSPSWGADVSEVVTAARWTGPGTKSSKEVGRFVDTSRVAAILESIESAPAGTTIDSLTLRAQQTTVDKGGPKKTPSFPVRASVIFDNDVQIGDTVPVFADYGYIQENDDRRVSEIDVDAVRDVVVVRWDDVVGGVEDVPSFLLTEGGDTLVTEAGDSLVLEGS